MFDSDFKFFFSIDSVCYQPVARYDRSDWSVPEGLFFCRLNLPRPWLNVAVNFFMYRLSDILSTAKTGLLFTSMETLLVRWLLSCRYHLVGSRMSHRKRRKLLVYGSPYNRCVVGSSIYFPSVEPSVIRGWFSVRTTKSPLIAVDLGARTRSLIVS